MRNLYLLLAVGCACFLFAFTVRAEISGCAQLKGAQKRMAEKLLASQYAYDCCDDTLANCLEKKPLCTLVARLAENICQRVAKGQDKDKIVRGLSRRARSMMPQKKSVIDLTDFPVAGEETAPVVLVAYACARCPYCSKLLASLHRIVVSGELKGRAKLYLKPFPIRGHALSKESGLAFVAASRLGRYWEFVLYAYQRFDEFDLEKQNHWAEAVGMDRTQFESMMADGGTRERLVKSKKEGIVNKVDATPTLFINGRKYVGDLNPKEIIDIVEEEYEQLQGIRYLTAPGASAK